MNMKIIAGMLGIVSLLTVNLANAATVALTPSTQTVVVGDAIQMIVQASDFLDGVSSGGVQLNWDPTLLTITSTVADLDASLQSNGFSSFDDDCNYTIGYCRGRNVWHCWRWWCYFRLRYS